MALYRLVQAPAGYPGRVYKDGRLLEHHLVWWQNTGQVVPVGFDVHHKDEDGKHNAFSNLELKPHGKHTREHHLIEPDKKLRCPWCKKRFLIQARIVREKRKLGQDKFFCSRSCASYFNQQRPLVHGSAVAYKYHKCRCKICRKAEVGRVMDYKRRKKMAG